MSSGYSNRVWACPFFRWDERRKVHCEGGCVAFGRGSTFHDYADRYCANPKDWERCTVAASLVEQYEKSCQGEGKA